MTISAIPASAPRHVIGLDLVRLAAAVCVMVYHLAYKTQALPLDADHLRLGIPATFPPWWAVSWWGWVGVPVFFVLSGVVIGASIQGASIGQFVRNRVLRLVPAMWICVLVAVVVQLWMHWQAPGQVALLAAKTAVFWPAGPWLLDQAWTLPIEIAFYGLMSLVILAGRADALRWVAAGLALLSLGFWMGLATGHLSNFPFSALTLAQHGGYFALGLVLAGLAARRPQPLDLLIVAVSVLCARFQIAATCLTEAPGHGLDTQAIVPFLIWLAAAGAIAACWSLNPALQRLPPRAVAAIRTAGLMTYPLYLVHVSVGMVVLAGLKHAGGWGVLAAMAASVAAALVITLYLEPPLRGLLRRGLNALGALRLGPGLAWTRSPG